MRILQPIQATLLALALSTSLTVVAATDAPAHVFLQYRDHRQNTYYGIILATLLLICGAYLWRRMKKRPSAPH